MNPPVPLAAPAAHPLIVHNEPLFAFSIPVAELGSATATVSASCHLPTHGLCCCTCMHHCIDGNSTEGTHICTAPLADGHRLAYANWPAHGLCESYEEVRP